MFLHHPHSKDLEPTQFVKTCPQRECIIYTYTYIYIYPAVNPDVFMVNHGYPWLFHGHVFIFHTQGQECNHSATKTWLTIVIIMVITSFPMVNHSSLKKEYNGRSL